MLCTLRVFLFAPALLADITEHTDNRIRRGHLGVVVQVRVNIGSGADIAMPQPLLNLPQADTLRIQ